MFSNVVFDAAGSILRAELKITPSRTWVSHFPWIDDVDLFIRGRDCSCIAMGFI